MSKQETCFFSIIGYQRKSHLSVFVSRWTGPGVFFLKCQKLHFFILIQHCYNEVWQVSHEKWFKIETLNNLTFGIL